MLVATMTGITVGGIASFAASSTKGVQCESSPTKDCDDVTLRDGRRLAYRIHGQGVPVFALHGMESSRHTYDTSVWGSPPRTIAQLYPDVQLIAVDRPGYGDSSPPPLGYGYRDFVDDFGELADKLGLARFCIAGHSSGGPYALAVAALMPERVVACAAISSDGPYAHPNADPELKRSGEMPADALVRSGAFGGHPSGQHAWKQGPMGYVCDYVLERIAWPFAVESIALGPRLSIWFGSQDVDAILRGSKLLYALIPGCQLREQARGHGFKRDLDGGCCFGHLAEIFEELVAQWKNAPGH